MTAHFEAKLHGFRRTQDGVVISYVIHPNDLSSELALAPLGTRYMVAFAEIGDDGKPKEDDQPYITVWGKPTTFATGNPLPKNETGKERRSFASLPLSQQAAIRCGDADFQKFMVAQYGGFAPYRENIDNAALLVREKCKVSSRSEIIEGDKSGDYWLDIETNYQRWLTDQRYAHVMRK